MIQQELRQGFGRVLSSPVNEEVLKLEEFGQVLLRTTRTARNPWFLIFSWSWGISREASSRSTFYLPGEGQIKRKVCTPTPAFQLIYFQ